MKEAEDTIGNEFSSGSSFAEDDLNIIFSSLEPLEDPKDDMYFFGGKDLLQSMSSSRTPSSSLVPTQRAFCYCRTYYDYMPR
jgi:hypothetical protein